MAAMVIVGASLAGARAAETLRKEGYDGDVVLIGTEPERPYERPPLSKGLLLGTADRDEPYVHDLAWYAEHRIDLRTGTTVTAIDRAGQAVHTDRGDTIGYDRLLLTTGATPRPLPAPGPALHLRTYGDSDRINAAITADTRVVIVGAGWIGLEVAAAARTRGAPVTVVTTGTLPLQRVLGDEMAEVFAGLHREHGVDFRFGSRVASVTAETVTLVDGGTVPADVVIAAVGVEPNTALAAAAGLAVGDGVLVDHRLRTSDPDIFAAGDVANVDHPLLGARVRVEHWANAQGGGPIAARAMLDRDVTFDLLPYFFTDQYDLGMEYAGWIPPGATADLVVRGDPAAREFVAFWLVGGRVAAGMNVNVWDVTDDIQALIRTRAPVDPARLADPAVPIGDLVA